MQIINSILDQDSYKLCMQWAVIQKFPEAWAQYNLINRSDEPFPEEMKYELQRQVNDMEELQLTDNEAAWLQMNCPFLPSVYIDFLRGYRFNPDEVKIDFTDDLNVMITGPWYRNILWEVPLLAIISELYYHTLNISPTEYDASYNSMKFCKLGAQPYPWGDFGTRRRFSKANHERVLEKAKLIGKDVVGAPLMGTSNVQMARQFRLKPLGTQAHEWYMYHGAVYGYKMANELGMEHWVDVYKGNLGIALSDTYTVKNFLKVFRSKYAKLFDGVRHDSGDPIEFIFDMVAHYENLGIDPKSKTIVFSDSLNPDLVVELSEYCEDAGIKCSFGIGTNLTNDLPGITPRNMVIKMTRCSPCGPRLIYPTVKLSDEPGKHTGDPKEIELCKRTLGIG